jgi:glyoxylase-like metal-dependent hydrolase (beta-lactamase superfamily II)
VQRAELEAARRPGFVPSYSPSPIDFDHPLEYRMIDGEHDVFGDGTVVLLPTFGHTPGHQSLLVRAGVGGVSRRATRLT